MPNEAKKAGSMGAAGKEISENNIKPPEIIITNRAFEVAQAWVKNMTGGMDSDPEEEDGTSATAYSGLRPARLGLGAKFVPHSLAAATMTPVEKKLRGRINAARQAGLTTGHDHSASTFIKETTSDPELDVDSDYESKDSKTSAFGRKQKNTTANLLMPTSKAGKRRRTGK